MSIEREYEIILQPEPEGGFSVFVPELPSVATLLIRHISRFGIRKN